MRAALLFAAATLVVFSAGARADEPAAKDPCDQFRWSLARERGWLQGERAAVASGAEIAPARAYAVALQPMSAVAFVRPPERNPAAGSFSAVLTLPAPDAAGLYQITLSDEAWLDVVQDDKRLKSAGFSGRPGCPGVRKSVRFQLSAAPLTIEISGASAQTLGIVIAPAP